MWIALQNKIDTWEAKQRRNVHGQGMCIPCKGVEETTIHLFVHCIYSQKVLMDIGNWLKIWNLWIKDSIENY